MKQTLDLEKALNSEVGHFLLTLREQAQLSLAEAARVTGFAERQLDAYEAGLERIPLENVYFLVRCYGFPVEALLDIHDRIEKLLASHPVVKPHGNK